MSEHFADPAFEPQHNFMFAESAGNDEDFHGMQRSIATMNSIEDMDKGQVHSDFMDPSFFQSHAPSWSAMQAIVSARASAAHQFGQVTPPDDGTPKTYPVPPQTQVSSSASAKSERARNAANQRHAKAKKARKDSARASDSPDAADGDGGVDDKRERYREKNRLAAAKCRSKKKTHTESLEESARTITATNNRLRAEERELRDLFSSLRHQALSHDPTQGCTCKAIHMYNTNKAQETARGAAFGLCAYAGPPTSVDSIASASASPTEFEARTNSFSGVRPGYYRQSDRSQMAATPTGWLPGTGADADYSFSPMMMDHDADDSLSPRDFVEQQ